LMGAKGLDDKVKDIIQNDTNDTAGNMLDGWQKIMEDQTIFSILREGTYDPLSKQKLLGHPFDNWDELVTSVSDVSLAYPSRLADNLKLLPPEKHSVALNLVRTSLLTVAAQIPADQFPEMHSLIASSLETINQNS
jgi:hypothetical protein